MLKHFKQYAPQENTHTEITELEQLFDFVEKCTHSEKSHHKLTTTMVPYVK